MTAGETQYVTLLCQNNAAYLQVFLDNSTLTRDYIFSTSGSSTAYDARYVQLSSATPTEQETVEALEARNLGSITDNIVPVQGFAVPSIIAFPPQAGATPTQITAAVDSSNVGNRTAFLVGTRLGTKGSVPYSESTDYTPNP